MKHKETVVKFEKQKCKNHCKYLINLENLQLNKTDKTINNVINYYHNRM